MTRKVDLLSYLPPFMREYAEIGEIMNAETPELQRVWDMAENTRKQLYMVTATEQGLQRFEKMLGIFPSGEDTVESRRARILSRWNDVIPYTYKVLLAMLKIICGDNFEVIPDFKNYAMEIVTHIGAYGGVRDLAYIIENVIPVNLAVTSNNRLDVKPRNGIGIGIAPMPAIKYFIQ